MQVSKGDFIIWNAAFWVATMHSVEVGLAAGLGTSIAIYVLRTVFAPLRQEGENLSQCWYCWSCLLVLPSLSAPGKYAWDLNGIIHKKICRSAYKKTWSWHSCEVCCHKSRSEVYGQFNSTRQLGQPLDSQVRVRMTVMSYQRAAHSSHISISEIAPLPTGELIISIMTFRFPFRFLGHSLIPIDR